MLLDSISWPGTELFEQCRVWVKALNILGHVLSNPYYGKLLNNDHSIYTQHRPSPHPALMDGAALNYGARQASLFPQRHSKLGDPSDPLSFDPGLGQGGEGFEL